MLESATFTLACGSMLADLVQRNASEVSLRIMNDNALYKLETVRIFPRISPLLGRSIGEDQIVVTPDHNVEVSAVAALFVHRPTVAKQGRLA